MMKLGELIDLLKRRPPGEPVTFDFASCVPTTLDSYRGYYDELALGFKQEGDVVVADLVDLLERAVGATFEGYKGGDYVMDRTTRVWVANRGRTGSTGIVRLADCNYWTVIQTAWEGD